MKSPPSLREYQQENIDNIWGFWTDKGYRSPIDPLATGLGKTAIAASLFRQKFDLDTQRVLVVVDKIQLVNQFWKATGLWFPESHNKFTIHDRPGLGRVMNLHNDVASRIIVATPQTLAGTDEVTLTPDLSRLEDILKFGTIDLIVYDEAHTAIQNRIMHLHNRLLEANPKMWTLGPTATPRRNDGLSLRAIFDSHVPGYNLKWGIANGFLCPIGQTLQFSAEVEGAERKKMKLSKFSNAFALMEEAWMEHARGRKTAWYHNSVQESRDFCQYMQERGHKIAHIDSEYCIDFNGQITTDGYNRERILNFMEKHTGECHVSNYEVLSTGWDFPELSCVCIARATEDMTWFTQVVGRGTRIHPNKENLLIMDFGAKQLELFMEETGLLDGHDFKLKGASVEDEEEVTEEIDDDPDDLEEDEIITGRGIIVKEVDLLNGFGGSWHRDEELRWSLQLNDELALVVIAPDPKRAEKINGLRERFADSHDEVLEKSYEFRMSYSLWIVQMEKSLNPNTGREYTNPVTTSEPQFQSRFLDLVLDQARPYKATYGDPKLFQPGQTWRKQSASEGQVKYLRRLGYKDVVSNMGEAAKLITHWKSVPAVDKAIKTLMKEVTNMYKTMKEETIPW